MKKTLILHHGCWAAAVVAAFAVGSLLDSPESMEPSGNSQPPAFSGFAAAADQGDSVAGSLNGEVATASGRDGGLITNVFDISPNAGWQALARQAVRDPNPIKRRLAFTRLLETLTPENAVAIREQLVELGADGDQWRDFNYSWGALAGREAFAFASLSKERDLEAALTGWASASPSEAIALLDNLPEEMQGNRDSLAKSVVAGLADRDRSLATDLVLRLANEGIGKPENLIEIVATEALRVDGPENTSFWSEKLPDGAPKAAAMRRVAGEFVKQDPEAAAQWAQRFANEDYAVSVIEEVGDKWAERDPVNAVSWLEDLPEGRGQSAGLTSVFGDWEDRDPAAATEYLSTMPQSPQRDSAISGFSRGYAWQDPLVAIAWAMDISDPNLRQESVTRAGQVFFRRDPASARDWLNSSGLPAEEQ